METQRSQRLCGENYRSFSGLDSSHPFYGWWFTQFINGHVNIMELNIILFLCNWGPHAAYQTLQDSASEIPAEIKMVRIPCTGRISKALLLKPFELGADGVALVGCEPGTCRYGMGTDTAQKNEEDTRSMLELLGLGKDRLRLSPSCSPYSRSSQARSAFWTRWTRPWTTQT